MSEVRVRGRGKHNEYRLKTQKSQNNFGKQTSVHLHYGFYSTVCLLVALICFSRSTNTNYIFSFFRFCLYFVRRPAEMENSFILSFFRISFSLSLQDIHFLHVGVVAGQLLNDSLDLCVVTESGLALIATLSRP